MRDPLETNEMELFYRRHLICMIQYDMCPQSHFLPRGQSRVRLTWLATHPLIALKSRHTCVGCGSTVQIRMRQKVVVLRELQRAIIYTTR
jgi:hypothetical protein